MEMKPKARTSNLVIQEAKDETLLYDLKSNKAFCLNETSALVWKNCDGKSNVSNIAIAVGAELGKPVSEELVLLALTQLKDEELLESSTELSTVFSGMSRRSVIKRIGFASAVLLPVVSSLVAPKASMAQSGLGVALDQCGPGFPTCGAGLGCFGTFTIAVPSSSTATGIAQCCAGGNIVSGTFCSSSATCAVSVGCSGLGTVPAPVADPACTGAGQLTCMYQ